MLYVFRDRPAEEQSPEAIDKARLFSAAALALEDISIYLTLQTVLVVRQGIEVKA